MRAITFNGFNLQTSVYRSLGFTGLDDQQNVMNDEAMRSISNGRYFREKKFDSRTIVVRMVICGDSIDDLEQKNDIMKASIFQGVKGNLDIFYAGATRRWVATVENVKPIRWRGSTREYEIEFRSESFGFDPEQVVLTVADMTTEVVEQEITVLGTYQAQPIYRFTINESTDMTRITVRNLTNNRTITANANYTGVGELVIDTRSGSEVIEADGVGLFPDGKYPWLEVGVNELEFEFTSTSHDIDVDIQYNKRYL